jgi:hypothetical protein
MNDVKSHAGDRRRCWNASDFEFSPAGHDPIAVDVRFGAGEGGSDRSR